MLTLPAPETVKLGIYDLLGRRIAILADGFRAAGRHQIPWDGRSQDGSVAWSGVYFARLEAAGKTHTASFIVTR